jgi:hypothetical protein
MDLNEIFIPLLESNKELPPKDEVLERFREGLYGRLEHTASAPSVDAATAAPDEAAASDLYETMDERSVGAEESLLGDYGSEEAEVPADASEGDLLDDLDFDAFADDSVTAGGEVDEESAEAWADELQDAVADDEAAEPDPDSDRQDELN